MSKNYSGEKLILESTKVEPGSVRWQSPSNIALVKYWGKHGNQLPRNPSISFTLTESYTETEIKYKEKTSKDEEVELEYLFEGKENPVFSARVKKYFYSLIPIFPFIKQLSFKITSANTFPHSSGIASSASSMSALALCLCSLEDRFFQTLQYDEDYERKASYVARLGSGSACRSIFAEASLWGSLSSVQGSSDEYAIPIEHELHDIYKGFRDSILIVSKGEKAVSSTAGHKLMDAHRYASTRYDVAERNCVDLLKALQKGDMEKFVRIVETEALQLHALMMMSTPSYMLFTPDTIAIIQAVREYRKETGIPVCFTLDAGPNVHLLYPSEYTRNVEGFIEDELLQFCEDRGVIKDGMGAGPLEV